MAALQVRPTLQGIIRIAQESDLELCKIKNKLEEGSESELRIHNDGTLTFGNRICVLNDPVLKTEILKEAHSSRYSVHPGATKMQNIRDHPEHCNHFPFQNGNGRRLLDFVPALRRTPSGNDFAWLPGQYSDGIEALNGRRHRSPVCWDYVGERRHLGPDLVQQTVDKIQLIREQLRTAQSRQKSYADVRRRELVFQIGDKLRKYIADPNHVIELELLNLREDLSFEEQPICILDHKDQVLRRRTIPYVKVQWQNHLEREAT
ncbi:uncharacterized protein LOC143866493 [Tasmannia lanceolata]|uniref:uncharacterized protein LOC143866493 n=1 Tax=Tasmannia lanceolata TaxID=3420 RepID=UPI00406489A9